MLTRVFVIIACLLVAGCSAMSYTWDHPNLDPQRFYQDDNNCRMQAESAYFQAQAAANSAQFADPFTAGYMRGAANSAWHRNYQYCMQSLGYYRVSE